MSFQELRGDDPRQIGPYRIVARLGSGGMGSVYLGQSRGGRMAAVKVVRQDLADAVEFRRRFRREVAAAQRVNGAYTAAVVDADPMGEPPWLATMYVRGTPLGGAVAEHGAWPEGSVLALGARLAEALEAIHSAGVVHRDLKPSNILLAPDGPRVIDFGISVASDSTTMTLSGTVMGSAGFMSPEQVLGQRVGPPSDLFSLGAVLTFAATGAGPFGTGTMPVLCYRTVHEEPDLRGLTPALREIVAACLAREEARRPAAGTVLDWLVRAAGDGDITRSLGESGWMPASVAASVEALPPAPKTSAPLGEPTAVSTSVPDGTLPGSRNEAPAAGESGQRRLTRRRMLIGGAGVAAAGLGVAGWQVRGLTGSTAGGGSRTSRQPDAASSGKARWTAQVTSDQGGVLYSATPSLGSGTLFYTDSDSLFAVTATQGKPIWFCRVGYGAIIAGATRDIACTCTTHEMKSVGITDGNVAWSRNFDAPQGFSSVPIVSNDTIYLTVKDDLYSLTASSGSTKAQMGFGDVLSDLVVSNEVAYPESAGSVYAADLNARKQLWRHSVDAPSFVAVADGSAFVLTGASLQALDARTGVRKWEHAVGDPSAQQVSTANGTVYALTQKALYAVNMSTGDSEWEFPLRYGSDARVQQVPESGMVLLSAQDSVTAVHARSGERLWRFPLSDKSSTAPVSAGGVTYFGSGSVLQARHNTSGAKKWEFTANSAVQYPTVGDDTVFFRDSDNVYAIAV